MNVILKISDVSVYYGSNKVLENVNFELHENDFFGIIGPNGGGKTTLLKVILGLLKPQIGEVVFMNNLTREDIGYLPQVTQIDNAFPISCFDVVLSGLFSEKRMIKRVTKAEKAKAMELLEMTGTAAIAKKPFGELSGGQSQRILLCRALIANPKLLILDEPETYVDSHFEKELYTLIKKLNKKMAIIVVSHDVGMVSSFVETIVCVNREVVVHKSNKLTEATLKSYGCPIDLITHGNVPHRVLPKHNY